MSPHPSNEAAREVYREHAGLGLKANEALAKALGEMERRWREHDEARDGSAAWLRRVQRDTHEWRLETIDPDITPLSQAAHASVEAGELLDLFVKDETYDEGWADEVELEVGDVVVALAGVPSLLGLDLVECVEAALEKNGARDWAEHKGAGR